MNLEEPKSLVHAKAEIDEHRRAIAEFESDQKAGKAIDTKEMSYTQMRINFLRRWIKAQNSGTESECAGCQILMRLYEDCKDVLPENWRSELWKLSHRSSLLTKTGKRESEK